MENDLHWILGKTIQSVHLKRDENYNNNIVSICLTIDNKNIVIAVDEETDTVLVGNLIDKDDVYKEEFMFSQLLENKKIIAFWLPVNNFGYNDVFMLGLDKFIPTHLVSTIASCIKISTVEQID
jgi:hypothetical protein